MSSGYDPILSLMTEIKNAILVGRNKLVVDFSGYREGVLKVLRGEDFLSYKIFKEPDQKNKKLQIELKEDKEVKRRLTSFKAFSSPGRRYYLPVSRLKTYLSKRRQGLVISTSRGVLNIKEAVKKSLGGEVLFEV